jgi:hypothetical protein
VIWTPYEWEMIGPSKIAFADAHTDLWLFGQIDWAIMRKWISR